MKSLLRKFCGRHQELVHCYEYPFLECLLIFSLLRIFFLSAINSKTFTGLVYEQYGECLLINWNCLPVASSQVLPGFSDCCVVFLVYCLRSVFPISPICPFLNTLQIFSNVYILNISSFKTMTDYCTETHWSCYVKYSNITENHLKCNQNTL